MTQELRYLYLQKTHDSMRAFDAGAVKEIQGVSFDTIIGGSFAGPPAAHFVAPVAADEMNRSTHSGGAPWTAGVMAVESVHRSFDFGGEER